MNKAAPLTILPPAAVDGVAHRVSAGVRVRCRLPGGGRFHMDRPLPFLCLHRFGPDGLGSRLVRGQPAYALLPESTDPASVRSLIEPVAEAMTKKFGAFLLVELWESPESERKHAPGRPLPAPSFTIFSTRDRRIDSTINELAAELEGLELQCLQVACPPVVARSAAIPESALQPVGEGETLRYHWIGLAVEPIYRGARPGELFPQLLLDLEMGLARVLTKTCYAFACSQSTLQPPHFHSLGKTWVVRSAWNVDRRLARVSRSFDFLLQATPINSESVWAEFQSRRYEKPPEFLYRPLPIDPEAIKRLLFNLPIESIEDPTLARLFREKQEELDRQITMLRDRGHRRFLYGSLQLYGAPDDPLHDLARRALDRLASHADAAAGEGGTFSSQVLAVLARKEIAEYQARYSAFRASVEIREDIVAGVMVARHRLLIARSLQTTRAQADALVQHEIGTHLLTYFNGQAQRLRLLHTGLAGYEPLQEGLAVLAEHLVGRLSAERLRTLAGRVIACRALVNGATFVETFRVLRGCGFGPRPAYTITTRVYRGGGLTKDIIYLRGLMELLSYLQSGGKFDTLFVGKIALAHVPIIEELQHRQICRPLPLLPSYCSRPEVQRRLGRLREGVSVLQLISDADARGVDNEDRVPGE